MITDSEKEALKEAINIIGGQSAVAKLFKIAPQSVGDWFKNGVPYRRVISLEKATKRKVSRYRLKPAFFETEL